MKKMTADEYVEIVESAIEKDPTEPVRIDFHLDQLEEIRDAHRKLFYRNGEFEQWFEKMSRHPKQELSKQGFMRVAFIGPEGPRPIRIEKSPISDCSQSSKQECETIQSKLQKEYGDGYHIEINTTGIGADDYSYCCEVWKGADWLRWKRATYTYKEIAESTQLLKGAEHSIHEMEPKAEIIDRKATAQKRNPGGRSEKIVGGKKLVNYLPRYRELFQENEGIADRAAGALSQEIAKNNNGQTWSKRQIYKVLDSLK